MKIPIYDPGKGVFTAADQDDLPPGFASELENFYLDRPGKIRKRDGVLAYGSSFPADSYLRNTFRFVHKDLTGGAAWLSLWRYSLDTGKLYVSNAAGSSWTLVEDIGVIAAGDEMRALVIGVVLRLSFSRGISPVWYGYIKRKFFHDLWDHSYTSPVWYDCDAALKYPATWTYSSLVLQSTIGGELGPGHYFYKVVPVFDGGQEALFAAGKAHYEIASGETNILRLIMNFSDANWNPRITHLNIYRQVNTEVANDDDALYQLVDVVSTQNDPAVVTGTGRTMERTWYDRNKDWGSDQWAPTGDLENPEENDLKYMLEIGGGYDRTITTNAPTYLYLDPDEDEIPYKYPDDTYYENQAYSIDKYKYVDSAWVFQSEEDTGTDGWGGPKAFFVLAASYEDNAYMGWAILEQATLRVILTNNDKVLGIDGDPANGNSIALRLGKVNWQYGTPTVTLGLFDLGMLDKGTHPLAGITSTEAYYKYSVWFRGRLYVLNLAFDPGGVNEQYPDWVGFSEIDQPDVIPNSNFIMPDTSRGGEGKGIYPLDKVGSLAVFYRHDVAYLQVPRAAPKAWEKHEHEGDIGLITDAAIVRTPIGYFFCYDTGIYFMGLDGRIKETPVSFPIDDIYRAAVAAGNGSSFSVMYLSERRIVLFNLGTNTEAWGLEIDSVVGEYPKWFKFPYGLVSEVQVKPERSALDENGYFYVHEWEGTAIYRMHQALAGTEVFGTKLKTAYIHPGDMEREALIRYARLNHKGSDNITPKVYLNDGAISDTLTVIPAAANGEEIVIKVKSRGRNVALELASAASADVDHEIRGIELEVG